MPAPSAAPLAQTQATPSSCGEVAAVPQPLNLVVIGNGMVGYKLCERLAQAAASARIRVAVFGEEPRPAYDRVHLTQYLVDRDPSRLLLAHREWYQDHKIDLHVGDPVVAIDRVKRVARSASGVEVPYDRLVFATGSYPFVPPIDGRNLSGVFVYRTIEDLQAVCDYSRGCKRAVVIGGGLLGLEAAKALKDLGLETHVVEASSGLMSRQLDAAASALLKNKIEELGVKVHVSKATRRIEADGNLRRIHFADSQALDAELIIIAAGIRPRGELAAACGLACSPSGAIQIDDKLRTSDPDVYAIGECALHRGTTYGLAVPGFQMAGVLAENLLGGESAFQGADLSAKLKLMGIDVASLGQYLAEGATVSSITFSASGVYRKLILNNNSLIGVIAVGEWKELGAIQNAIDRKQRLSRWALSRFKRTGTVFPNIQAASVNTWPETATVCNCMSVKRGELSRAIAGGCASVTALARATGASTMCGSCKPLLCEMLGAPAAVAPVRGRAGLLISSAAVVVIGLAIVLAGPVPYADSVQHWLYGVDYLWRDSEWKKVSGFSLLGLAALGMGMALRKRVKWISFGDFGFWRMAHAILGALAISLVIVHTGMRMGENLNFCLMLNFLVLSVLGAAAGGVTALEHRLAGTTAAKRLRTAFTWAHVLLVWPLPVLMAFHILAAYYF